MSTYLDWAATSYPKPESVYAAVDRFARTTGIGNDRSLSRATQTVHALCERVRAKLATLFDSQAGRVIFSSGATDSLNTLLQGLLQPGDHVITSPFEHNAVLRPLQYLKQSRQISISPLPAGLENGIDLSALPQLIRPKTRLVIVSHQSNVFGVLTPLTALIEALKPFPHVFLAVDAAQTAGSVPISLRATPVDFLAFSGHKGLLGPTGTGGFVLSERLADILRPIRFGGTGVRSTEEIAVEELPWRFEVGTQNTWGIAGLDAGLDAILTEGVATIHARVHALTSYLVERLKKVPGVTMLTPSPAIHHGIVSFLRPPFAPVDLAMLLETTAGVLVRAGLHCAPESHRLAGTLPSGTVRASLGALSSHEDVETLAEALEALST